MSTGGIIRIEATAELLQSLGLLESTMKTLGSLLSRAFLDHLFENPVGWQFVYTKHDPTAPSITMRPTNYTTTNLTPHGCISLSFLHLFRSLRHIPPYSTNSVVGAVEKVLIYRPHIRVFGMHIRFPHHQSSHIRAATVNPTDPPAPDHGPLRQLARKVYPQQFRFCRRL